MTRILLVEDDLFMAEGLVYNLEKEGYQVEHQSEGPAGLEAARTGPFDLIILDLMLPGMHGFTILEQLRRQEVATPVIILSAQGEEVDKIRGFDAGADDYLAKPFGVGELLARIRARLKPAGTAGEKAGGQPLTIGPNRVHLDRLELEREGQLLRLTPREVEILQLLLRTPGSPVPREVMLRELWGLSRNTSRTLDTHVTRLRKKLEPDPANPRHLVTVHGVGYRLSP